MPWNAAIYKERNSVFEHQCSGTILNARIILSAIHCFWDEESVGGQFNASLYRVKVGKTFREYDDTRETTKVQSFSVRKISDFDLITLKAAYSGDIAILLMDNFIEFGAYISPICIDYDLKYANRLEDFVPEGRVGMVAGWGLEQSDGKPSPVLKKLEMSVATQEECTNATELDTVDEFCARSLHRAAGVCHGDSGAALVFPEEENGITKFFIRGFVSANTVTSCDFEKYSKFTNTAIYLDFIKRHEIQYRPRASLLGKLIDLCFTQTNSN